MGARVTAAYLTGAAGACAFMIDAHSLFLISAAVVAVIGLILLIAVYKLNPFITLLLTSLALAVVTGMPLSTVVHSFEAGVGGTLGHIAMVVALGTMLGKMMAESGGADQHCAHADRFFRREARALGDDGDRPGNWPAGVF
jgi:H+/gluconate symporter-like permease